MHFRISKLIKQSFSLLPLLLLVSCDMSGHAHHEQSASHRELTPTSGAGTTPWEMVQQTDSDHFSVRLTCQQKPFVGDFQQCSLALSKSGVALDAAVISIDGGMRAHGHGLPTKPEIVASDVAGEYEIRGLKFSMTGEWVVGFKILSQTLSDQTVFTFSI